MQNKENAILYYECTFADSLFGLNYVIYFVMEMPVLHWISKQLLVVIQWIYHLEDFKALYFTIGLNMLHWLSFSLFLI